MIITHRERGHFHINDADAQLPSLLQSRTTAENVLREGFCAKAVYASRPLAIFEFRTREMEVPEGFASVPIHIGDIKLYYGMLTNSQATWLIERERPGRETRLLASGLRVCLGRANSLASVFRTATRNMPRLADSVDEDLLYDSYTQYLLNSGRQLQSIRKSAAIHTGADVVALATIADDMMRPEEIDDIVKNHQEITRRQNVIRNLADRLRADVAARIAAEETRRRGSMQVIVALFSNVKGVRQSIVGETHLAGLTRQDLLDDYTDLYNISSLFTSELMKERRDAFLQLLDDIGEKIADYTDPTRPVKRRLSQLRALVPTLRRGHAKVSRAIFVLENALDSYASN